MTLKTTVHPLKLSISIRLCHYEQLFTAKDTPGSQYFAFGCETMRFVHATEDKAKFSWTPTLFVCLFSALVVLIKLVSHLLPPPGVDGEVLRTFTG